MSSPLAPGLESVLQRLLLAVERRQQGRGDEALAVLDELLAQYPQFLPAYPQRISLLLELARYAESAATCQTLIEQGGRTPEHEQLRDDVCALARAQLDAQLHDNPTDGSARWALAEVELHAGRYPQALAHYQQLASQDPTHPGVPEQLALVWLKLNEPERALACYQQCLGFAPESAVAWFNLGTVHKQLNQFPAAEHAFQQALRYQAEFPEAELELGLCRLSVGDFQEGWRRYEWRWRCAQLAPHHPYPELPLWRPTDAQAGTSVLLWAEQGLGDCIQFLRFVPLVAAHVETVFLHVPESVRSLLAPVLPHWPSAIRLLAPHESAPAQAQCPLMSLPWALAITTPPPLTGPYLYPDAERVALWQERMARPSPESGRPRIGVSWAGRQRAGINWLRDMPLAALAPLFDHPAQFFSLQKELPYGDSLAAYAGVQDLAPDLDTLADTAAAMMCLDAVVSVDTAVAHLCGALGKTCYLLLPYGAEWRWQSQRHDSPWYPSLRLIRQTRPGDWHSVVAQLLQSL